MDEAQRAEARELLAGAQRVTVLTGAGISAESGVPTFRGAGGLWKQYRFEELATPQAFARDPQVVWEWYQSRREGMSAAAPNPGHRALVDLEAGREEVTIVTQNVDRLHQLAGSRRVHELHGSLWVVRCVGCGEEREDRSVPFPELPPRCACGDLLRPGVVWFGEALPMAPLEASIQSASECDVFLLVGTSAVVYPAAGVAEVALECGKPLIEVNPEPTAFSRRATVSIRGKSGEVLPLLRG